MADQPGICETTRTRLPRPRRRHHRALRLLALTVAAVMAVTAALLWLGYRRVNGNIHTDRAAAQLLGEHAAERPRAVVPGAQNVFIVRLGPRVRARRPNPAFVLLHVSADRSRAAMVRVPRRLMVRIPGCRTPEGYATRAEYAHFVRAFQIGGTACAIRAFERLSGIRIDHHLVVRGARGRGLLSARPARLYPLLNASTSSLTTDRGLDSLPRLYALVSSVRAIPADRLAFRTVPERAGAADALFAALREDRVIP